MVGLFKINMFFYPDPYDPISLLNVFKKNSKLSNLYSFKIRQYTIEEHSILVLKEFDKYFSNVIFSIRQPSFRFFLALHDIGKPLAYLQNHIELQNVYTRGIFAEIKPLLQVDDFEFAIYSAMLKYDILGEFFQNRIGLLDTVARIKECASVANLPNRVFLHIFTIFFQSDTAAYTFDAGGYKYLEKIFEYKNARKQIDIVKNRLIFSRSYENKYIQIENSFINE